MHGKRDAAIKMLSGGRRPVYGDGMSDRVRTMRQNGTAA